MYDSRAVTVLILDEDYTWCSIRFDIGIAIIQYSLADLFIISDKDIASYADDSASYIVSDKIDDRIKSLEEASAILFQWFDNNLLKSNPGKCHLLK